MTETALAEAAERFAGRLRRLLDGTVTQQAPIAARTADGRALVGVICLDGNLSSTGIPTSNRRAAPARSQSLPPLRVGPSELRHAS